MDIQTKVISNAGGDDPALDPLKELFALVRCGCSVRFDPKKSAYGVIHATVLVWLPVVPGSTPRSPGDEVAAVSGGQRPSYPLRGTFNLIAEKDALARWLGQVRHDWFRQG